MPTEGAWQDGLEHEIEIRYEAGVISYEYLTEASESQPDHGWDLDDMHSAADGAASRLQPDLGNHTSESSIDAWDAAQIDTMPTTAGSPVNTIHEGSVDNPVGGADYSQADSWQLRSTDVFLDFDRTPEFENPMHFVPPIETWPAGASVEIEGPQRFREIESVMISGWGGLTGNYVGVFADFGEGGTGWPARDNTATPTTLRGASSLPGGTGTWVSLNAAQAQLIVDLVQAGSSVDADEYARAGFIHNATWPGIWGANSYAEDPGLPTLYFRIRFRTCRYRFIYDLAVQPPQRVFPREDGLIGPGAKRNFPPPRSRQRSPRIGGGYL